MIKRADLVVYLVYSTYLDGQPRLSGISYIPSLLISISPANKFSHAVYRVHYHNKYIYISAQVFFFGLCATEGFNKIVDDMYVLYVEYIYGRGSLP